MHKLCLILLLAIVLIGCKSGGGSVQSGGEVLYGGGGDYSNPGSGTMPPATQPEPATMLLFGIGLSGLAAAALKKRNKK